jgi:Xaa-Pro aminopeptidase
MSDAANFPLRRDSLRRLLAEKSLAALLVTNEINVSYLTGFTGDSSYLLVSADRELLITDGRYTQQLAEECPGLPLAIRQPGTQLIDFAAMAVSKLDLPSIGIEAEHVTIAFYEKLGAAANGMQLAHTSSLVESLREIKDAGEIATLRQAIGVAESGFIELRAGLARGQDEKRIADDLEYNLRRRGATCSAFSSIIGVGPRAALPHGRPTQSTRLGDFPLVLIDWGARYQGYHSDLTRVLVAGKLSPQIQSVYGVVLAAQKSAIDAIRPGAVMKDVDAAARRVIEQAGHGKQFNHSLGHGIGLEIHELPRLAPEQNRRLAPGMVVTVEPGIYLAGQFGVRIEDDVLVTEDGCEVLTSLPKQLEECIL